MMKKLWLILMAILGASYLAACSAVAATPITIIQTVVVKETVPAETSAPVVVTKEVPVVVTKEVPVIVTKEVEKQVVVVQTVPVIQEVKVVQTVSVVEYVPVNVLVTPTPTPTPTPDLTNPKVKEVMDQITLVQHHFDPETGLTTFSCASNGHGLNGVSINPNGARFVGPNSMDFDLWGTVALFKIMPVFKVQPEGHIFLVPEQTGGKFVDSDGIEYTQFTLPEALDLFASGDAVWIGNHGEAGRIGNCDPQYITPTPTPPN